MKTSVMNHLNQTITLKRGAALILLLGTGSASFGGSASTAEIKRKADSDIRHIVTPLLEQYCREQCKIIEIDSEVDVAVDDEVAPGFEEETSKVVLAPASGRVRVLMDESLGAATRQRIVSLVRDHLESLDYPVQVDTKVTQFPQPITSHYKVADLRERVTKDIRSSVQMFLSQFCKDRCVIGDFDVQTEALNPEEVESFSGQDVVQEGSAAVRVRGVKATIVVDQRVPPEEANAIVEMARMKLSQYKNVQMTGQVMKFPQPLNDKMLDSAGFSSGYSNAFGVKNSTDSKEVKEARENKDFKETRDNRETSQVQSNTTESRNSKQSESVNKNERTQEKFERIEKIERVENGDAVQKTLESFRFYGMVLSAIVLALLMVLVALAFRKHVWDPGKGHEATKTEPQQTTSVTGAPDASGLTSDEKAALIGKRIEADRLHQELVNVFSEQPKVAKHVFTHVLTEEGVETTAQYLELFGESVVMDLLRDPGLQSDCAELMDFFARNTFDINDDERVTLLRKLYHRTVTGKMQVHGSRSATLFDFLTEMDTPQIVEMVKNESNTVKAIVLTQCDQKKRNAIFNSHDENTKMKLMTELSRIDHLPKNYIFNVSTALRRKKAENPKLNTEALPGTDVLVTFLEKASIATQRTIIHQLMSNAGADALNNLKAKLVSLETLRFIKDTQLSEIVTNVKHDEIIQFLKGCQPDIRDVVLSKLSQDLAAELGDELSLTETVSREAYLAVERKVLNRIKILANQGMINLAEVNERMFAEEFGFNHTQTEVGIEEMRKVG